MKSAAKTYNTAKKKRQTKKETLTSSVGYGKRNGY
jgi:hypothetical protein